MISTEEQKRIIDAVKAATHGMSREEKRHTQELILMGACIALDSTSPPAWRSLLMIGRAHKLFR